MTDQELGVASTAKSGRPQPGQGVAATPSSVERAALLALRLLVAELKVDGLPDDARLVVMAQNPANFHHWSKSVGGFTARDVRLAQDFYGVLAKASGQ